MRPVGLLSRIMDRLREGWCKEVFARGGGRGKGVEVGVLSPKACKWCVVGAMLKVLGLESPFVGSKVGLLKFRLLEGMLEAELRNRVPKFDNLIGWNERCSSVSEILEVLGSIKESWLTLTNQ